MSNEHSRKSSLSSMSMLSSSLPQSSNPTTISGNSSNSILYSFKKKPFVIGVAGGTSAGKSTVCSKIIDRLGPIDPKSIYLSHEKRVVRISQDSFYRKLTDEERQLVNLGQFDFDHPSAFDVDLMVRTIREICEGKMVRLPVYNYNDNEISDLEEIIYPADVVLFEGLLVFYFPELLKFFHMKIFVDTDSDTRLSRRVLKDVKERKRDLNTVLNQYLKFVKPSFEEFCLPTKKFADIVIPRGPENEVAVDLIATQILSVFDPALRHQSIRYPYYEAYNKDLFGFKSSEKRNKIEKDKVINNVSFKEKFDLLIKENDGIMIDKKKNGHIDNFRTNELITNNQRSDPIPIKSAMVNGTKFDHGENGEEDDEEEIVFAKIVNNDYTNDDFVDDIPFTGNRFIWNTVLNLSTSAPLQGTVSTTRMNKNERLSTSPNASTSESKNKPKTNAAQMLLVASR